MKKTVAYKLNSALSSVLSIILAAVLVTSLVPTPAYAYFNGAAADATASGDVMPMQAGEDDAEGAASGAASDDQSGVLPEAEQPSPEPEQAPEASEEVPQANGDELITTNEATADLAVGQDGLLAASVGGPAAQSQAEAAQALVNIAGADEDLANEAAQALFSTRAVGVLRAPSSSADGTNVDSITARWLTPDTVDNGNDDLLYLKPLDDADQAVSMQINYALSGEHDYQPYDITITIPSSIFSDRDGNPYGTMLLPYEAAPGASTAWEWMMTPDGYEFYNTKTVSAATKGFMAFAITGLTPDRIVDMQQSADFNASIRVVTHKGSIIDATSNDLTAQIDTEARVTAANKIASSAPRVVDATYIPEAQRIADEDQYVVVCWNMWSWVEGNQPYNLKMTDTKDDAYSGFIINATSSNGQSTDVNVFDGYRVQESEYSRIEVAYPLSQFDNLQKEFRNKVEYTLTETDPAIGDDEKLVTNVQALGRVSWVRPFRRFTEPSGHFNFFKSGNDNKPMPNFPIANSQHYLYASFDSDSATDDIRTDGAVRARFFCGIYPKALNDIRKGDDVDLSYTIDTVGYLFPWTLQDDADYKVLENYGKKPVTMVTSDKGLYFDRKPLEVGKDYSFKAVEFAYKPYIDKALAINPQPDGSIAFTSFDDGTVDYQYDDDMSHIPVITLEIERNGSWQEWATADWTSGALLVTLADGSTQTDKSVELPTNTTNFRTKVTATNASVQYYVRPIVTIKADGIMKGLAEAALEGSPNPTLYVSNAANMKATSDGSDTPLADINRTGANKLKGYSTDMKVTASKSAIQDFSDERSLLVHYSADVTKQSSIMDKSVYELAMAEGDLLAETSGTWYDLLPKGMTPDMSTLKLRDGDTIRDAYTIENYKGSGRTLLVVKADLTPQASTKTLGEKESYYQDVLSISFDAIGDNDSVIDYGEDTHNVIAYESDNDEIGTIEGYRGEPDDPDGGNNVGSASAFASAAEKATMTDLDATRDTDSFVYAGISTHLASTAAAQSSLSKNVSVNNDGYWSNGTYEDDRTVYEGGQYTYRLRMMSDEGSTSKNMVLYDSLENFYAGQGNDEADIGAPRWQGTLTGVDVSQLEAKGCAPVIYYSTVPNLNLQADDGINPSAATDLTDTAIWSTTASTGLSQVKAIAVDATKCADGSDFELQSLESIVVLVRMKAPAGEAGATYVAQDAHAYNNTFLQATSVDADTGASDDDFIHKDYTKVGIEEYNLTASKVWDDDDDRDGIRPASVTVHLYADDVDTGKTVTLSQANNWTGEFKHLTYSHDDGSKIRHSLREEAVAGYRLLPVIINGSSCTLTNIHTPERTQVAGTKTWEQDTTGVRPASIVLNLLADGQVVQTQKVHPDGQGNWNYSFDNLYKYEDGHEIVYTVEETVPDSYTSVVNGFDITNIYHPYGDLTVGKTVVGNSPVTTDKDFTFTFTFKQGDTPVFDDFTYTTSDGRTGTVATGGSLTLKDGQTATITEIPEGVTYRVVEQAEAGYTLTDRTGDTGVIAFNQTSQARFTNTYAASGVANLSALKTLEDRQLEYHQFRFELVDENGTVVRTAMSGKVDSTATDEGGTVTSSQSTALFGALRYTQADHGKTFTYIIREVDTALAGYTYDSTLYTATVKPIDNGDGTMGISVVYTDAAGNPVDTPSFTNAYQASGSVAPKVYKQLHGRDLTDGEFSFQLGKVTQAGGAATFTPLQTKTNDATGTVAFDQITYDQTAIGKTFLYAVHELAGTDTTVDYDGHYELFAVTVSDNGDATLSTAMTATGLTCPCFVCGGKDTGCLACAGTGTITSSAEPYVFKNGLHDGGLDITKHIQQPSTGADPDQLFKFRVELSNANGDPVDIDMTKATLESLAGGQDSIQTQLLGASANDRQAVQTHAQDMPAPEDEQPVAEDTFDLLAMLGDTFNTLFGVEKAYASTTVASGTSGGCTWTFDDEGLLTISPTNGTSGTMDAGFSGPASGILPYRPQVKNVVFKDGVSLNANASFLFNYFTNMESVTFPASFDTTNVTQMNSMFASCSSLTALNLTSFDTANVTNMDSMFVNCSSLEALNLSSFDTAKVTNMNSMFFNCSSLEALNLSSFDTAKVTNMNSMFGACPELAEVTLGQKFSFKGSGSTVLTKLRKPDTSVSTGKWVIADKSQPAVTADDLAANYPSATYPAGTYVWDRTTFTLVFDGNGGTGSMVNQVANPTQGTVINPNTFSRFLHKFTGWNTLADGTGTAFAPGATIPANTYTGGKTVTLYAQWEKIDPITKVTDGVYEILIPGDYVMHLTDSLPAGTTYRVYEETPEGWVLVSSSDATGTIRPDETANAQFTNKYMPGSASVQLRASKTLDGAYATAADAFSFELVEGGTVLQTKAVADGGEVLFDPIPYTAGGNRTYTIREVAGADANIIYDTHAETVTVSVVDDGKGNMTAAVAYDADGAAFANTTKPGKLMLTKLTGDNNSQTEFAFTVTFVKDGVLSTQDVTLKGGQTKTFDDLVPGTTYSIAETDVPAGWTQTGTVGTEGTIVAGQTAAATVTNTYNASGTADIKVYKNFEHGVLEKGMFSFSLYDKNPQLPGNENIAPIATATNGAADMRDQVSDADGNPIANPFKGMAPAYFDTINYTAPGTYSYWIKEQVPASPINGVTYDTSVRMVTVVVADMGDGRLSASVDAAGSSICFSNTRATADVNVTKALNRVEGGKAYYDFTVSNTSSVDVGSYVFFEDFSNNLKNGKYVEGSVKPATLSVDDSRLGNKQVTVSAVPANSSVKFQLAFDVVDTTQSFKNYVASTPEAPQVKLDKHIYSDEACTKEMTSNAAVTKGQKVYYKVSMTNNGTAAAASQSVTDLVENMTIVKADKTVTIQPSEGAPQTSIKWETGAIAANGGHADLVLTCVVDKDGTFDTVTNTAKTETQTIVITNPLLNANATKALNKIVDGKAFYDYTVTNTGAASAASYTFYEDCGDNLKNGMLVGAVAPASSSVDTSRLAADKQITVNTLPANTTVTFQLSFDIINTGEPFKNYVASTPDVPSVKMDKKAYSDPDRTNEIAAGTVVEKGQNIYYRVTMLNNSFSETADSQTVYDTLSDHLTATSVSASTPGSVVGAVPGKSYTWTTGKIAPFHAATLDIDATVDATGTFDNVTNTAKTETQTVVITDPIVTVSVTKDLKSVDLSKGRAVYEITLKNASTSYINMYEFTDDFTNLVNPQVSSVVPSSVSASIWDNTVIVSNIPAGSAANPAIVTLSVTFGITDDGAANGFLNYVGPKDKPQVQLDKKAYYNSECTEEITAGAAVKKGQEIYYRVTMTNTGAVAAPSQTVTDTLSDHLTATNVSASAPGSLAGAVPGKNYTWTTGAIQPGAANAASLTITATVDAAGSFDNVTNTAKSDEETIIITNPVPNVKAVKELLESGTPSTSFAEGKAAYKITVENTGDASMSDYKVTEDFGSNLTDMSVESVTSGDKILSDADYSVSGNVITLNKVAEKSKTEIVVTFKIKDTSIGILNKAAGPSAEPGLDFTKKAYSDAEHKNEITEGMSVKKGDTIYYQVSVKNTGAVDSASKTVVDTLSEHLSTTDAGITIDPSAAPASKSLDGKVITWNTGAIASGATATMDVAATVDVTGSFNMVSNTATMDDTTIVITNPVYDVSIEKTGPTIKDGKQATYTITVANNGSELIDYKVIDNPVNMKYNSITEVSPSGVNVTANDLGSQFTIDKIAAGSTVSFKVTYDIIEGAQAITNFVFPDKPAPGEPVYKLEKTRIASADADALAATGVVAVGDTIYYKVVVTNEDTVNALSSKKVVDTAEPGLKITAAEPVEGALEGAVEATGFTWNTGDIAAGKTATVIVTATVTEAATASGHITNKAKTGDHTVIVTDPLGEEVDKDLDSVDQDYTKATYTVKVTNLADTAKTDVQVTDVPAKGLSNPVLVEGQAGVTQAGDVYTVSNLGPKPGSFEFKVTFDIDAGATEISNRAFPTPPGPNPGEPDYTLTKVRVASPTDMTELSGQTVDVGDTIYYKVNVHNNGAVALPSQTVVDSAQDGLEIVSAKLPDGTALGGVTATGFTWETGAIADGEDAYVVVEAKVGEGAKSYVTNKATTGPQTVITTDPMPEISIDKALKVISEDGAQATYTVKVTNAGKGEKKDYIVKDIPTDNLEYVSNTNTAHVAAQGTPVGSEFKIDSVPAATDKAKGEVSFDVTYDIGDGAEEIWNHVFPGTPEPGEGDYDLSKTRIDRAAATPEELAAAQAVSGVVAVGDTIYYKVVVSNDSDVALGSKRVVDTAVTGLKVTAATAVEGTVVAGTVTDTGFAWDTGAIAAHGTATVVVTATVTEAATAAGHVTNKATSGPHTVITTDPLGEEVDKDLDSVDQDYTEATYTVKVTNLSDTAKPNYRLTDVPAKGLGEPALVAQDGISQDGRVFTVAELGPRQTVEFQVKFAIDGDATEISNRVFPTPPKPKDPQEPYDPQKAEPDYTLTKVRVASPTDMTELSGQTVDVGDTIYYKVNVHNNGAVALPSQTVVDSAQDGLEIVSAKLPDGTALGGVTATGFTWETGAIADGEDAYVVVEAKVGEGAKSYVTNKATTGPQTVITTDPMPEISIDKALTKVSTDGKQATYTVKVTNAGKGEKKDYIVKDIPTDNLEYVSNTNTAHVAAQGTPVGSEFKIDSVPAATDKAKGEVSFDVTYDIGDGAEEIWNHVFPGTPEPGEGDYDLSKTRIDRAAATPEELAAAQAVSGVVAVGDTIYYKVVVTNTSDKVLNSKEVVDTAVTGLTLKGAVALQGVISSPDPWADGDTFTWDTGDIAAHDTATVVVTATVTDDEDVTEAATDAGHVTNKATSGPHTVVTTDPLGEEVDKSEPVISDDGKQATYTITVKNLADTAKPDYLVKDVPGLNLAYASVEGATTDDGGATFKLDLAPSTTTSFKVTYDIADGATEITNHVFPDKPTPGEGDYDLSKTRIDRAATTPEELAAAQAVSGVVAVGDTIYYRVTVSNTSDVDLGSKRVVDTAVTGLKITAATAVEGTVVAGTVTDTGFAWDTGAIAAHDTATVVVTATVTDDEDVTEKATDAGHVTNKATSGPHTVITTDPLGEEVDKSEPVISDDGKQATYTITVKNLADTAKPDYLVKDVPGLNLAYASVEGATTDDGGATFKLDLAPSTTTSFKVTYDIADGATEITNHVFPDKPTPGEGTYDLSKTRIDRAAATPEELAAAQAVSGVVAVGDTIYYKVTVSNDSDVALGSKRVVDTAVTGLKVTAATAVEGTVVAGTVTDTGFAWDTGAIAAHGTATVVVTATVTEAATDAGHVTNKATSGPHTVVTTDPLGEEVDKNLLNFNADEKKATYTITVKNLADIAKNAYTFSEEFSSTLSNPVIDPANARLTDNGNGTYTIDTLGPNETFEFNLTFDMALTETDNYITNHVFPVTPPPTPGELKPDYTLDKVRIASDDYDAANATDAVQIDSTLYYKVVVTSTGNTVLPSKVVTDIPGKGLTITDAKTLDGTCVLNADGTVTWNTPADLAVGSKVCMVITATVGEDAVNAVTNKAVSGPHTVITTDPLPDVAVDKNLVSVDEQSGEALYVITVTNKGKGTLIDYQITDEPTNMTYKRSDGVYANGVYTIASLAPGATVTINAVYSINSGAEYITNYVFPTKPSDGKYKLSKVRVNSDTDMTPATSGLMAGDTIYYMVAVQNTSDDDVTVKRVVTDTPGVGLTIVRAEAAAGNGIATLNPDGTVTWTTNDIAKGDRAYMVVTAIVGEYASGIVTNKATTGPQTVITTDPIYEDYSSVPKTGDALFPFVIGLIIIALLACGIIVLAGRKGRKNRK